MIIPAYADVDSVSLDKNKFSIDEKFTISGTVDDEGRVLLTGVMKGPSSEKLIRNAHASEKTFSFVPIDANEFFKSKGTYTITVFTEYQNVVNGTIIEIEYKDGFAIIRPDFELVLNSIGNKQVKETEKLSFTASITDSKIKDEIYSLEKHPNGATINKDTGVFSWTPTSSQSGGYVFDVIVNADPLEVKETITVTVTDKPATTSQPTTKPKQVVSEPKQTTPEPPAKTKELGLASFVEEEKDPQSYVDRYNSEAEYKKWFDTNYPMYDSIYQAVGLEKPLQVPASFVKEGSDPQSYVDRYNSEAEYKKWFDTNYPMYDSIYQAVGLEKPLQVPSFVKKGSDPQSYVDRYNSEAEYKKWFDTNYPMYDSIYQAVGLEKPKVEEKEYGICGTGTKLIDGVCTIIEKPAVKSSVKPWWKFW